MKCSLRKEENYSISNWTGGKTKELAIFPRASKYLDRNFIWRLSSATVELDESDFSKLPDYDRVIMVLKGSVVLTYDGKKTVKLNELEQDSFDGGWKTKSFGRITDFNLMVRKGGDGILDIIRPDGEAKEFSDTLNTERKNTTHALYCKEGYFVVNTGEEQKMVNCGELFVMEFGEETPSYSIMGEGVIIRAQIGYDYEGEDDEEASESLPGVSGDPDRIVFNEDVKGGFGEDFRWSMFIANTQFKGARHIIKKLKTTIYDDVLYDRIHTLEKYFVSMIVYLLGLLILLSIFAKSGMGDLGLFIMVIVWTIVDSLIVSPLVFYMVLPRPIASHIKDINKMSEEELAVLLKKQNRNERLEKILKRYRNAGKSMGLK